MILVSRKRGLKAGAFLSWSVLVQHLRSAAAGARHGHGEPLRGTTNGSGGAFALASALAASPTHSQNPESQGVFLEVQGEAPSSAPPSRPRCPAPLDRV